MRESPGNTVGGKPGLDMVIFGDVGGIIEIDKVVLENLPVDHTGDKYQKQAYEELTGHNVSAVLSREQSYERWSCCDIQLQFGGFALLCDDSSWCPACCRALLKLFCA